MAFHHRSRKLVLAIAALIIVAIVGLALVSGAGVPTVSSTYTVTLQNRSAAAFYLPDSGNSSSIYLSSVSASGAVLYIGRNPVLTSPITVATLSIGQLVNVSTAHTAYADLQIRLVSSTADSATIALTYVPSSLGVSPSSGLSALNGTLAMQQYTTVPTTTAQATTTAATSVTTTASPVNHTLAVLEEANATSYGVLINKYKALYERDAGACTRSQYDIDYSRTFGSVPSGPSTFANASVAVPTTIKSSITKVSAVMYNITYSSVSGIGTSPAMVIQFNATGQYVVASKFTGIFLDQNYATTLSNYQAVNTSDPCSVYLP